MPRTHLHDVDVHYLEGGETGETIVCLHAALSSSQQWSPLIKRLSSRYRIIAPDLYGDGETAASQGVDSRTLLRIETRLIQALVEKQGRKVHLIGHSYGGVIALKCAQRFGHLLESLTLIEPVLFNLLSRAQDLSLNSEPTAIQKRCRDLLDQGDALSAAEVFYSYWNEEMRWSSLPSAMQERMAQGMKKVCLGWETIRAEGAPVDGYREIEIPTLLLSGDQSPKCTQWITQELARILPNRRTEILPGAGHLSPITHAKMVIEAIQRFLQPALESKESALAAVEESVPSLS